MKKGVFLLLLVTSSLFLLIGCQSQENAEEATSNSVDPSMESETDIEMDDEQKESTTDTDKPETTEQPSKETVIEEEPPIMYRLNEENWALEPIAEDVDENVLLLTIDDVPDKNALKMAQLLKDLEIPAIFFANGHFLETEEDYATLRQIHDLGFHIGNHTMTHPVLSDVSEERQREEIIQLNTLIEEIIGEKPKFFRAPHGMNTDYVRQLVKEEGMLLMNWTYGYDYFEPYMDAEKLKQAMITGEGPEVDVPYSLLRPGANLLMHDREWTLEALEDIVKGLQEKGYSFVDPNTIELPTS